MVRHYHASFQPSSQSRQRYMRGQPNPPLYTMNCTSDILLVELRGFPWSIFLWEASKGLSPSFIRPVPILGRKKHKRWDTQVIEFIQWFFHYTRRMAFAPSWWPKSLGRISLARPPCHYHPFMMMPMCRGIYALMSILSDQPLSLYYFICLSIFALSFFKPSVYEGDLQGLRPLLLSTLSAFVVCFLWSFCTIW